MQKTTKYSPPNSRMLLKNTSVYTLGNILPQIANLILLPIYTDYLPPEEYGIYVSIMMISSILVIFYTMALERSLNRLYYDYDNETERKKLLGTVSIMLIICATFFLILFFGFQSYSRYIFKSIPTKPYFQLSFLIAYGTAFLQLPLTYFRIKHKAGKFIALNLTQFIINAGLSLYFIIVLDYGAEGLLSAQMISYGILIPVFIYVIIKHFTLTFNRKYALSVLAFSVPMVPSLLAAWVINLSDRIFIENYLSVKEVGIYSLGYQIAMLVAILSGSLFSAYNPVFYELASDKKQNNKALLKEYNHLILLVISIIAFGIALFAKEVISILFPEEYETAYKITIYVSVAYWVSSASGLLNLFIYQNKKTLQLMFFMLISAGINIGLNFILIPQLQSTGAALSTIITFIVFFVMKFFYAQKQFFIPFKYDKIFYVLFFAISFILIFEYISTNNVFADIFIKTIVFLIFAISIYLTNKKSTALFFKKK